MSSPFCLRKNSLLFPNPQPTAKPLPTVGPKLNKSVVWKRKLLDRRRAYRRARRPRFPMEASLGFFNAVASQAAPSSLLNSERKGRFGPAPGSGYFCRLLFYDLRSTLTESLRTRCSGHVQQPWAQPQPCSCPPTCHLCSAGGQALPSPGSPRIQVRCCEEKRAKTPKIKKAQPVHLTEKSFSYILWQFQYCDRALLPLEILLWIRSDMDNADKPTSVHFCNVIFCFCYPESVTDKCQLNCCFPTLKQDPPYEAIDLFPTGSHAENSDLHSAFSAIKGHPRRNSFQRLINLWAWLI